MDIDTVRKDAPPAETIERIHALLDRLGFPRERARVRRWAAGDDCHSCHLRFANYPLIYSNGKGVTPDLAYASALAEFIERLQCRADLLFTTAGSIHRLSCFARPAERTFNEVVPAAPDLAATDLADLAMAPGALPCLEFADVFGGRVVDLPYDALYWMTGSSGMCAGNTPEEAIAHGICEVFERHVIHALERGRVAGLPTLMLEALVPRSGVVRGQLEALRAAGTDVIVKDATLGGVLPVVALVLIDHAAGTCQVSFGSDPVFEAALSRCITEAFQGASRLFRPMPSADRSARPLDTYNNLEVLVDRLVEGVGTPCTEAAFADVATSAEALRLAVELGEVSQMVARGGRFVIFTYAVSILVMTFRRPTPVFFIRPGESAFLKGLPYTLISLAFGWWGLPWGFIYTPQCIIQNLSGGRDVTNDVTAPLRAAGERR